MPFNVKSLCYPTCASGGWFEENFSLYRFDAEMVFVLVVLKPRHVAAEATWVVGENVTKILPKYKDI